jgi:serine/threonine protein kinase
LQTFNHPNIVKFFGLTSSRGRFYIVTEFLKGNLYSSMPGDKEVDGTRSSQVGGIFFCSIYCRRKSLQKAIYHRDKNQLYYADTDRGFVLIDLNCQRSDKSNTMLVLLPTLHGLKYGQYNKLGCNWDPFALA